MESVKTNMDEESNKWCVIQYRATRRFNRVRECKDGLFLFHGVPQGPQARDLALCGGRSMELWHKRLGYPLKKVLRKVPNVI